MSNFNSPSVNVHQFAMVPRADIPRSTFRMQTNHKTTFDAGYLVPILCEEVLPGDNFRCSMSGFARLSTPIYPLMDNLKLDTFFFFVPNRLVWDNWHKFMGEQANPSDSISFVVPKQSWPAGGYSVNSLQDFFGLPTVGGAATVGGSHSALPLRAYNLIWNEWFRDQNLQNAAVVDRDDGPDSYTDYWMRRRGKRYDYFTGCLAWPQKGASVPLLVSGLAPVVGLGSLDGVVAPANPGTYRQSNGSLMTGGGYLNAASATNIGIKIAAAGAVGAANPPQVFADLSAATSNTINQLRQAFQIQRLLERDARGGTRYVELIKAHFGVLSPDFRMQRPEYLGGGSSGLSITPVVQTSGSGASGTTTPLANLAAMGTLAAHGHGFSRGFTEHGYIIGLASVRADINYQQGLRRHWSRDTRYDFYFPAFANLGEQAVLNKEIYVTGGASDSLVFGYQERWAELRHSPPMITGLFRSTAAGTLDAWHCAQRFTSLPVLGDAFIQDNPPLSRVLAVGAAANGKQLIADFFFDIVAARPLPMYSVPGLIDHF